MVSKLGCSEAGPHCLPFIFPGRQMWAEMGSPPHWLNPRSCHPPLGLWEGRCGLFPIYLGFLNSHSALGNRKVRWQWDSSCKWSWDGDRLDLSLQGIGSSTQAPLLLSLFLISFIPHLLFRLFSHPTQFCLNSLDWHWRPFTLWSQPAFLTSSSYTAFAHSSHSDRTGLHTKYTLIFLPASICPCCSLLLKCSSFTSNSQNPTAILDEVSLISSSVSHPLAPHTFCPSQNCRINPFVSLWHCA